jgi:putative endonuclease
LTEKPPTIWSVYILRCGDGTLYTGIATDVERRIAEHQSQGPKSAKYTRGKLPLTPVYQKEIGNRSAASKEELRIKSLTRKQKQALIAVG